MASMHGKIAIVTGGTQGLGAAIAQLFAERGAKGIVTCGRDEAKGRAKAEAIAAATGATVVFVRADLAQVEDCARVVAEADRAFGRVDALVNAAGDTSRGTIIDTSPELFDRIFAVNTRAPFFLMQDTIKLMRRDKVQGTIVNISSMSAMGGQSFISAYCASKGALDTLTRNTAHALLRNRIRVNGLNIGWMASEGEFNTQRVHHGRTADWLEEAAARQPFGRLLDPIEVARAVVFLSCDESGMMTGATINFDQSIWGAYDTSPQPETPL
ncbi:SDR family oxidoreductase [Bradyrhizobium sp. STM 3557]|uniref:SDR family oxidoreductase n=1 Tax=Bradyrhizobium sp. STM 3557 TaxID=578920 RepID=UPI0038909EB5